MMLSKVFEVRDHATNISVLATCGMPLGYDARQMTRERDILSFAGYDRLLIIVTRLTDLETQRDPNDWRSPRTMPAAHAYIEQHWDTLQSGALIDVRVVLGESDAPCASDFEEEPHGL